MQMQSTDSLPAPDPCLPPLQKIKNEPFGDNTVMKLQGDEVLDKLNEFADSTLEFGSSLLKRLMKAEAFVYSSSNSEQNESEENRRANTIENQREGISPRNVRFPITDSNFEDEH